MIKSRSIGSRPASSKVASRVAAEALPEAWVDQLVQIAVDAVVLDAALQGKRIGPFQFLRTRGLARDTRALSLC